MQCPSVTHPSFIVKQKPCSISSIHDRGNTVKDLRGDHFISWWGGEDYLRSKLVHASTGNCFIFTYLQTAKTVLGESQKQSSLSNLPPFLEIKYMFSKVSFSCI